MSDAYCATLFIRGEEDRGRDRERDEETDDMKASLVSGGFNLSHRAYPPTQIIGSRMPVNAAHNCKASSIHSDAVSSYHPETTIHV